MTRPRKVQPEDKVEQGEVDERGVPTGPAITHAGHPAAGKVHIVSPADHVLVGADAVIQVDAHHWSELTSAQQMALLDHELEHLVFSRNSKGQLAVHADGRVKLVTRQDDWLLTGFVLIVRRHGDDAIEAMALAATVTGIKQLEFDFTPKIAKDIEGQVKATGVEIEVHAEAVR